MPRLAIEITQEQQDNLTKCFPDWGMRSLVIRALIDDLVTVLLSPKGPMVIAGIISRHIHLPDISPHYDPEENNGPHI